MLRKFLRTEVLLPALVWAAAGDIDEASARLPFALAGLGVVLAVGGLGLRMYAPHPLSPSPTRGEGSTIRSQRCGVWCACPC